MDWKYKAVLQRGFSLLPFGVHFNYFFQRYVTRSLPNSDEVLREVASQASEHIENIRLYWGKPLQEAVLYEFGAGVTFAIPLMYYSMGVNHQTLVDIRALVRPTLVNHTIARIPGLGLGDSLTRVPQISLTPNFSMELLGALREEYGIDYKAPCDARKTMLDAQSFDCITSTNTLEHIPRSDILAIFHECHRLLRDDGVMSFRIDYQDHYSYFDPSITVYNFLQYSDRKWDRFNPSLHYQNRLRHYEYLDLVSEAGFAVVKEKRKDGDPKDIESLNRMKLDRRFQDRRLEELAVRSSILVLRKESRAKDSPERGRAC